MKLLRKLINLFFKIFRVKQNKIMLECGRGRVDDNPYAVYKYIKKYNSDDFDLKFMVKKGTDISMLDKKDVCYYRTFLGLYHLSTSKYWIRSQSIGSILDKKENQIYIQTWHGQGIGKKMGNDITGEKKLLDHAKEWDYLIASDEENKKVMCSSTGFDIRKSIVLGSPVSDYMHNHTKQDILRIKKEIGIEKTKKKIVLYAPTFRDENLGKDFKLKIMSLKNIKDYIFLIRLHPLMNNRLSELKLPENFINVSLYPDIQDLNLVSDVMITDYSSAYYTFILLNKPVIFYAYDLEEYEKTRGFYFDYKAFVPGPIIYNEEDLLKILENDEKIYTKTNYQKIKNFNKKFNSYNDGNACKRLVEKIKDNYFIDNLRR